MGKLIVAVALAMVALAGSAHAQTGNWAAVAVDGVTNAMGAAAAGGSTRADVERRAMSTCGKPTCQIAGTQENGCAGAMRLSAVTRPQSWTGRTRADWDVWFASQCPTRNCLNTISCTAAPAAATPTSPTTPTVPSVPSLPKIR